MDNQRNRDPFGGGVERIVPGSNVDVDSTDPTAPVVSSEGGGGVVEAIVAGSNITVDSTDPANPIVSATGGAGIESIVAGPSFIIDSTDPANPIVKLGDGRSAGYNYIDADTLSIINNDSAQVLLDHGAVSISAPAGLSVVGTHLNTPTGTYNIGADDSDLVLDGASFYFKLAGVGTLIIGTSGVSLQGLAVFSPAHVPTASLPDPADHPGGVVWDPTTLSLAVSDGSSWKHIAAV